MEPLVSILIPAYNAQNWIAESITSAVNQSWGRKEIIIIDDGSKDNTLTIARRFESPSVRVVSQENQGAAAARNKAWSLCQGDYIQWLDADDLLSVNKISHQIEAAQRSGDPQRLLSCGWGFFAYCPARAKFVPTSLWQDLSPLEWLVRKLSENLHMQTGTWLVSREVTEAAGAWDTTLANDDDGEYFCRVLLASSGTAFVQESRVYYRVTPSTRVSYIGQSNQKKNALLRSMKLHIHYLRSLEDSEPVRRACVTYLQNWLIYFYPERLDIVDEMQALASSLGGKLEVPRLRWKYAWLKPVLGWERAKRAQMLLPQLKSIMLRKWERYLYSLRRNEPLSKF
ncbi:MAG: glycosyltransferase family 2 protein [Verrucomicrobia bacterium]|nr:glycosyltransferase family 2 protein [Verrucomicrobiota bacterium]